MESFPTFQALSIPWGAIVTVEVKHRVWGDGRIRVDGVRTKVLRDTGGWYVVEGAEAGESTRVLYRDRQDLVVLRGAETTLRVPFSAGEGAFEWGGRHYHIANMVRGEVRIDQEGRQVVRGRVTDTGLHLESVAAEMGALIRSLAWGLTLRSESLARAARIAPPRPA